MRQHGNCRPGSQWQFTYASLWDKVSPIARRKAFEIVGLTPIAACVSPNSGLFVRIQALVPRYWRLRSHDVLLEPWPDAHVTESIAGRSRGLPHSKEQRNCPQTACLEKPPHPLNSSPSSPDATVHLKQPVVLSIPVSLRQVVETRLAKLKRGPEWFVTLFLCGSF